MLIVSINILEMVNIPSQADINKAWEESISRVPNRYKQGIERTQGFISAAIAGEDIWAAKTQEAIADRRRATKLGELSDTDWKNPALNKGAARIGPGMTASKDKRSRNYEPIRAALAGLSLPARVADTDTNIDNRVKLVVRTMQETAGKR